jgi:hypothetical protein
MVPGITCREVASGAVLTAEPREQHDANKEHQTEGNDANDFDPARGAIRRKVSHRQLL